jgi:acyl dehydratase
MYPEARLFTADDLRVGQVAEFEHQVTEDDVLRFAENSGDFNPLHVDPAYAKQTRFGRQITHGAFQVGLASALVGMHLPGQRVLLGSIHAQFPAPLFFPARVRVRGELTAWDRRHLFGRVRVTVIEVERGIPTAEIVLGVSLLEGDQAIASPAPREQGLAGSAAGRKVVLVTGSSGASAPRSSPISLRSTRSWRSHTATGSATTSKVSRAFAR